jgi:hypothetical protein
MQKRNVLNSPRLLELKHKRQRAAINKFLYSAILFFILFSVFIYVCRIPRLNIQEIKVTGNKVLDTEDMVSYIKSEITGKYFWLIPKSSIFFYSKNSIKNTLSEKYKRLKDIELSIVDRNNLQVSVSEREAVYTWCGEDMEALNAIATDMTPKKESCFFVDKEGYLLDEAPYFSGDVYFKFFGRAPGGRFLSPDVFDKLIFLKNAIEHMGLDPKILYLQKNDDIKIYLSGKNQPEIIFKLDSDFQKIAENLGAAIGVEPLRTDLKNKYSSLLYIDLRFGNKVYYKFK